VFALRVLGQQPIGRSRLIGSALQPKSAAMHAKPQTLQRQLQPPRVVASPV
jgi:hypothetical protein